MAAVVSVDGCGCAEERAARRLAADRAALFLRAAADAVVREGFEALVLRVVRRPAADALADLPVGLADFLALALPAAAAFRLPLRAGFALRFGAALRAPLRLAAALAPFFFFFSLADADPDFAERFFAAFAISLPPA